MRYFTGIILLAIMISACSTPEVLSDEPAEVESTASFPEWYDANRVSSSDSTHFNGYSMAVALDSDEAINAGKESAIANLRYEIDRFAEGVRESLVSSESGSSYNTPQFIINLRNTVQGLHLSDSMVDNEFETRDDDIIQVYTRVTLNLSEVIDQLSENLADEIYTRALHASWE